jgi:hypothetical protein
MMTTTADIFRPMPVHTCPHWAGVSFGTSNRVGGAVTHAAMPMLKQQRRRFMVWLLVFQDGERPELGICDSLVTQL